ncbi:MAG: AmmeMemoRadiSam system radical SAM enzyme [Proteobacteria bacterium]|nr:AmmeMemoRadiSam system radical SAM enzyme [Pseudomonadota bacterium]
MIIRCDLCPKRCLMEPGQSGECRIRVNLDGKLVAVTYGYPCTVHVDPIEKKPFFHFLPGSTSLSIATVGCNLHCKNCQNWEISQQNPEKVAASKLLPAEIPKLAVEHGCRSVSYTYTDPVVYYEYTVDSSVFVREAGLKNALVTAGYINREPWAELCRKVDAVRIDLKALSDKFYRDICNATLQPVLDSLVTARSLGIHIEVINLLIPTLNDSDKEIRSLCLWIVQNLGREIPLHFSRFFPNYQMKNLPPTPAAALIRAREIARNAGLYYVYLGNILIPDGENTFCPECRDLLVERRAFQVLKNNIENGRCPRCHFEIYGVWL